MKSERVKSWVSIIANLGVIASLLLLAFEINQSTKATVAAASTSVVDGYNTLNLSVMSDPQMTRVFIVGLYEPEKLTDIEAVQFAMWVRSYGNQIMRVELLSDLGLFSDTSQARGGDIRAFAHILATLGGKQYLDSNKNAFPSWLLDEIEPYLDEESTFDWMLGRDPLQVE